MINDVMGNATANRISNISGSMDCHLTFVLKISFSVNSAIAISLFLYKLQNAELIGDCLLVCFAQG
jgi:hypothetical protein